MTIYPGLFILLSSFDFLSLSFSVYEFFSLFFLLVAQKGFFGGAGLTLDFEI